MVAVTFVFERASLAVKNVKQLKFIKGVSGALAVLGVTVGLIEDATERVEKTGKPLSNKEWAGVIISSIGLNAAATILSGVIGSVAASLLFPQAPVANVIVGGLIGCGGGYLCSIFMKATDLQNKIEDGLIDLFNQLFPAT